MAMQFTRRRLRGLGLCFQGLIIIRFRVGQGLRLGFKVQGLGLGLPLIALRKKRPPNYSSMGKSGLKTTFIAYCRSRRSYSIDHHASPQLRRIVVVGRECCKLPEWGPRRSTGLKWILVHSEFERTHVATKIVFLTLL